MDQPTRKTSSQPASESYRSSLDHDLDLSRQIYSIFLISHDLYGLAHVARWGPYNLQDLRITAQVSWVGSALQGRS